MMIMIKMKLPSFIDLRTATGAHGTYLEQDVPLIFCSINEQNQMGLVPGSTYDEQVSVLDIVYGSARGKGLPVLKEAMLKQPFLKIRADIKKTAYASYWAELINEWMEKGEKQIKLYHLLKYVLGELDFDHTPEAVLSILFEMRFMSISGHSPNLRQCSACKTSLEGIKKAKIICDLARGGIVCHNCSQNFSGRIALSKGTIKQLLWIEKQDLIKAKRIRFTPQASMEGIRFLEAFVPYHLGKEPRSLKFLRQIRA